jgi:hypothetical protein
MDAEDEAARCRNRLIHGSRSRPSDGVRVPRPPHNLLLGGGSIGEVAMIMRPMGSSHRISSHSQQLDYLQTQLFLTVPSGGATTGVRPSTPHVGTKEREMKNVKMLYLATCAISLIALVIAGPASATILTGSGGMLGTGTAIEASAEGTIILHPPIGDIECSGSSMSGSITNAGSSTETVTTSLSSFTATGCNATFHVINLGTIEIHTSSSTANNNGTVTSTGLTFTIEFAGFHCIYKTNGTDLGIATGSSVTGGRGTIHVHAFVPREGGRSGAFCGEKAEWTGSYQITNPSTLNVD